MGKKANLCITDPPYNCSYEGGTGMRIMNDNWSDSKKFYQFLLDAFKNAYGLWQTEQQFMFFIPMPKRLIFLMLLSTQDFIIQQLVFG